MRPQTKTEQRREFCARHRAGETYAAIAKGAGVSRECVRYWCRRQRAGGDGCNQYRRGAKGLLSEFAPVVRYVILRLKLAHPRWGRKCLRFHLGARPALRGLRLPDEVQIGRYVHQWLIEVAFDCGQACAFHARVSKEGAVSESLFEDLKRGLGRVAEQLQC